MQNPERVELVRRRLGLTKIGFAKALDVDRKTVQRFEAGEYDLSPNVINDLVNLSGYPKEFFEKGGFDYPNSDAVSFRSLRSLTATSRDAALAAGALAFELDDWIDARFELAVHSLPRINSPSPVDAASALRATWNIGERPIGNMINLAESHGVRVFSLSEETRHLDAYSFWRNDRPYVFLNMMKTPEHSRFDAAHELGHLLLHRHGGPSHRSAEDEANAFASAFLMPIADLMAHLPVVRGLRDLLDGKKRWRVSASALAYTLHKHGIIPESVREVYVFKHSFLSMRRIDAKSRKARAVLVRFSKSLASRRHLPSQANVLSTTHRLGMTSKPTAVSHRLTISVSKWGKIFFRAWSNTGPWYPPSAKSFSRNGKLPNRVPRARTPPSRPWILAGCTMACSNRPTVSTRMWRFLPLIFLPAS